MLIIPTAGIVRPQVKIALENLDRKPDKIHVQKVDPIHEHDSRFCKCALNATHTRNEARKEALKTSHTHYFWLDSDVVPPPDTIDRLLEVPNKVAGGWYPARNGRQILNAKWVKNKEGEQTCIPGRYVAGKWVDVDTFANYHLPFVLRPDQPDDAAFGNQARTRAPKPIGKTYDPVKSDLAPLGCLMMTRDVLELLEFQDGTKIPVKIQGFDGWTVRNDCLQYGVQLWEAGIDIHMSPRVLCQHLP